MMSAMARGGGSTKFCEQVDVTIHHLKWSIMLRTIARAIALDASIPNASMTPCVACRRRLDLRDFHLAGRLPERFAESKAAQPTVV